MWVVQNPSLFSLSPFSFSLSHPLTSFFLLTVIFGFSGKNELRSLELRQRQCDQEKGPETLGPWLVMGTGCEWWALSCMGATGSYEFHCLVVDMPSPCTLVAQGLPKPWGTRSSPLPPGFRQKTHRRKRRDGPMASNYISSIIDCFYSSKLYEKTRLFVSFGLIYNLPMFGVIYKKKSHFSKQIVQNAS